MAAQNVTQFLQGIGANNLEQVGQFLQNMQGQVQAAEQRAANLQDTFNQQQDQQRQAFEQQMQTAM